MSKERELLKRAKLLMECSDLIEGTLIESKSPALIKDIEEILAQPEQESVYQKLLKIEDGIEIEILPSELWQDGYETGKRTMQPKQEPVAWIIETEIHGKLSEWVCTDKKTLHGSA